MINDGEFPNNSTFTVNLDEVINSNTHSSIVKMLALQIKQNSYMTVGEFFRKLSDNDLQTLVDTIEEANEMDEDQYLESALVDDLLLIAMMLSQAEGGAEEDLEELHRKVNCLCMLTITTSLNRKGFVDAYYENYSLQQDANENIITKRKEGVDYDQFLEDEDE